jgi:hypothetical protein
VSEEQGFDLVMPFVTVTSKGGPHDDDAYTAGWEMGLLDALLDRQRPSVHEQFIQADSEPQADLIAMRRGYSAVVRPTGEGWAWAEFTAVPVERKGGWLRRWFR